MVLVDWVIVCIVAMAVLGGLFRGFFRSAFSLGGLIIGLALAAWNYGRIAAFLMPILRMRSVADTIAFLLITLLVTALISWVGALLGRAFSAIGLGWLDGLAGAAFGFLQGVLAVVLGILIIVAFFPQEHWLAEAKLPRLFFGACHVSANMTPTELGERIRHGLMVLGSESSRWMAEHR